MNDRKNNPCYQCLERQIGCHSSCEHYKAWKAIKDKERVDRLEAIQKAEASRTVAIAKWKRHRKK